VLSWHPQKQAGKRGQHRTLQPGARVASRSPPHPQRRMFWVPGQLVTALRTLAGGRHTPAPRARPAPPHAAPPHPTPPRRLPRNTHPRRRGCWRTHRTACCSWGAAAPGAGMSGRRRKSRGPPTCARPGGGGGARCRPHQGRGRRERFWEARARRREAGGAAAAVAAAAAHGRPPPRQALATARGAGCAGSGQGLAAGTHSCGVLAAAHSAAAAAHL
jgi:hypothetical protein